ncbi:MAG: hypothetical protein IID32_01310, partial [Planctomycetes bacterium]|nr:hypothetical protein [Planctomycetota bacterium]
MNKSFQLFTIIIGCVVFLASFVFFYNDNNIAGSFTLIPALIITIVGSVGPETIANFTFKRTGKGTEFSFTRNTETQEKTKAAITATTEIEADKVSEQTEQLVEDTKEIIDAKRSASDYLILATDNWKSKDYIEALTFVQQRLRLNPK